MIFVAAVRKAHTRRRDFCMILHKNKQTRSMNVMIRILAHHTARAAAQCHRRTLS